MFQTFVKVAFISGMVCVSGCVGAFNGPEQAVTYAEAHPISVDSQVVTLTIDTDPTTLDLSQRDHARLRAFAEAYMRNGHGPITVTAPSGGSEDFDGQEMAADIRGALHEAGVPWESITGATYRTGESEQLIVSYTHYVASPSECGIWKGVRKADYRNMRSPNMGCATMNNIAAVLADPHDLVAPTALAPRDATRTVRAFEAYRAGEVTSTKADDQMQVTISDN